MDGVQRELARPVLVVTIGRISCAIPVMCVVETMRPLASERDTCMHRGEQVQQIAGAPLVTTVDATARDAEPHRVVVLRTNNERVALLVDDVHDVRVVAPNLLGKPALATADAGLAAYVAAVLAEVRVLLASREADR